MSEEMINQITLANINFQLLYHLIITIIEKIWW